MRRATRKGMIAATILSIFTIGGCAGFFGSLPMPSEAKNVPTVGSVAKSPVYRAAMVNCEDFDIQPCYTYDEGSWRVVLSYDPYKSVKVYDCKEDWNSDKQKLPCVWKQDNKKPKGHKSDPSTRNVYYKGRLG